ncbi:MAG TPA: MBG domain-containing protein, partial [Thermoanaerobaculia bacterium]|nr:MBG domain-containing protein [Thermoanaerobaculia bacterium]
MRQVSVVSFRAGTRCIVAAVVFALVAAILFVPGAALSRARDGLVAGSRLQIARSGHTATPLPDGTVLVVGGEERSGPTTSSELVLPDGRVIKGPHSIHARTEHTATVLSGGGILIAGGRDQFLALDSTEIYDPATGAFGVGPRMSAARAAHVAVRLNDGRLLVAGGDEERTAEFLDANAVAFVRAADRTTAARFDASAVLLLDGRALIAGGRDAEGNLLDTAEIFDPATRTFAALPSMHAARLRPLLRVLPDGKVQVLGGDPDATMEIFDPSSNRFTARAYVARMGRGAFARAISRLAFVGNETDAELRDMSEAAVVTGSSKTMVIGGRARNGLRSANVTVLSTFTAWVTTDKADYAPGETVVVTGGGFAPGETVKLLFERNPETTPSTTLTAVADGEGKFASSEYVCLSTDAYVTFTLTATGQTSGFVAQTSFTDAPKVGSVTIGSQTPNPVTAGNNATYTITVARGAGGGSSGSFTATLSVTTALPSGAVASFSTNPLSFTSSDSSSSTTLTISTTGATPAGTTSFTVKAATSDKDFATNSGGSLVVVSACSAPAVTTQPLDQNVTYSADANFSAAATGTSPVAVQWQKLVGATWTDVAGATATTLTVSAPTVAQSGTQYRAVFSNDCGTANSNPATLTVSPRPITVTADAKSKTYGDDDPLLTYQISGGPLVTGDSVTGSLTRVAGETVGSYAIQQGTVSAGPNYSITFVGADLTITARPVAVTADAKTKVYGNADPELTYQITSGSLVFSDAFTGALTRASGENVGTYAIQQGTLALNDNYTLTFVGADLTITARPVTVTADAKAKVYGNADPELTYQITSGSLVFSDAFTGALTRVAG